MVNPLIPISTKASEIHGITDADVADKPTFKDISEDIFGYFDGACISGYNVMKFDIPMLVEEFLRVGINLETQGIRILDSMQIYHKKQKRDLSAALSFYCDETLENAHDAEADTLASYKVFMAQMEIYDDIGSTIDEVHNFCTDGKEIIDFGMSLTRNDKGEVVFNFGKHKGKPIISLSDRDWETHLW